MPNLILPAILALFLFFNTSNHEALDLQDDSIKPPTAQNGSIKPPTAQNEASISINAQNEASIALNAQNEASRSLDLLPYPKVIETGTETISWPPENIHIHMDLASHDAKSRLNYHLDAFLDDHAIPKSAGRDDSSIRLHLGIPGQNRSFRRFLRDKQLSLPDESGEEGYLLHISGDDIIIAANSDKGLYYGLVTFSQYALNHADNGLLKEINIYDWPDMSRRGLFDDISRGPVPTMSYMKEQIQRASRMKYNVFMHYVENVVKTESRPDIAPAGGALTLDEYRELVAWAKKYYIEVIGNFQSFGHFYQILNLPQYEHLKEGNSLLTPASEESYELLRDVYRELIPAIGSSLFHVNSDETFDLGKGASREMVEELGLAGTYARHINRLHQMVDSLGARAMIWGDILLQHPEIMDMIPEDIIIVTWNYDPLDSFDDYIKPVADAGFDIWICPGVLNSFSLMPDFQRARTNNENFIRDALAHGVDKMLNAVWDDGHSALFSYGWYGFAYAADQSWHSLPGDVSYERRFNRTVYRDTGSAITSTLNTINRFGNETPTHRMNEAVFWLNLIPRRGDETLINLDHWGEIKRIADTASDYFKDVAPSIYQKDMEFIGMTIRKYHFMADSRFGLLKASSLYREAAHMQRHDRNAARERIREAYETVNSLHTELRGIHAANRRLWLAENRVYALDRVSEKFSALEQGFYELEQNLMGQLENFDKGHFLAAPGQIRLDIRETDGWYFRDWLMIDPIPNPNGYQAPGQDHFEETGGISETFPNVTDEFTFGNARYRWRRAQSPYFSRFDLTDTYPLASNKVIYMFAHIDTPVDQTVRALAGSSDGMEVFVNGESVFKRYEKRSFQRDSDEMELPLKSGRNHLMIRLTHESGDWAFSFRLPDHSVRNSRNRYYIRAD